MPSPIKTIAVIDLGDFDRPESCSSAVLFAGRKLGGQSLIVRMARRLSECARVDEVVVVGSGVPSSLLSCGIAGLEAINLPSCHTCERLGAAVDRTQADWVVYVPANRPFVDAVLIDQLLARVGKSSECDYLGYASTDGDWRQTNSLGLAGEVCHADTLRRLRRNADRLPSDECGSIASWLQNAPGAYHLKFVKLPVELDRSDLRFTIQDENDWDDAQLLCDTFPATDTEWQQLARLVLSNQPLRESMATRNG